MKVPVKNYLSVTKKEWNGMVVLIILMALVLSAPYVYQTLHKGNTINFSDFDKAAALLSKDNDTFPNAPAGTRTVKGPLFTFNPNKLPDADWLKLGLTMQQVVIIKNYQTKGGKFYVKEDLKKIYTITNADYERLEPYIKIPGGSYLKKVAPGVLVELNNADSARLTMIRGIGPSFARRIVRYRERLGGFYSKEQLKEIFGIDKDKYAEVENGVYVNRDKIIRVNANTLTFNELRRYPYLNFKQMDAILEYHNQHGDYLSINDMKNIAILDEGILRKIEPYLVFK